MGFHDQLLEFEKFENIKPSPRAYPGLRETFAESVLTSSRLFIEDLVLAAAGNFQQLMTSNHLPGGKYLTDMSRSLFAEAIYNGIRNYLVRYPPPPKSKPT